MNEYIYHYTSIETLALILKTKKIRFNSLKNVDDINETEFSDDDEINLSSHTLISCWTDNDEENLAFWNMYTPNMKGVRIKISKELFNKYTFLTDEVVDIQGNTLIQNCLVPKNECFNENYWIIPFSDYFYPIEYTDDKILLKPKIYNIEKDNYIVKIGEIGKYKSKIWKFQNEVRFKLFILPTKDFQGNNIHPLNDFHKILKKKIPAPIDNYFLEITNSAFKNIEITLGPKCSLAEEIIVESLIEKYNPEAKIKKNKYLGLIR